MIYSNLYLIKDIKILKNEVTKITWIENQDIYLINYVAFNDEKIYYYGLWISRRILVIPLSNIKNFFTFTIALWKILWSGSTDIVELPRGSSFRVLLYFSSRFKINCSTDPVKFSALFNPLTTTFPNFGMLFCRSDDNPSSSFLFLFIFFLLLIFPFAVNFSSGIFWISDFSTSSIWPDIGFFGL